MLIYQYSYRNLWVRRLTTALTAGGMGLVVFVFATVLMLAEGLQKTLISTGSPDNAVFIRRSSETEMQSMVPREQATILEVLPEVATGGDGASLAARELVILVNLPRKDTGAPGHISVRGIKRGVSLELRPQIRLTSGREINPGASEIMAGKSVAERFGLGGLGQGVTFGGRTWTVVGLMDGGGTGFDSEIWGDADTLMSAFKRPVYSSVIVRMGDPAEFDALKDRVLKDPRLTVEPWRETAYYRAQSELMARFIRILGISLTLMFSLGAIIGSMVTMYAAVANRTSEIGTLRALGFRRAAILGAFLTESVFLGFLGGLIGLAAASLMDRMTISTLNWQTFSELTFRFTLTRDIAAWSLCFAMAMGLLGGALPSVRAARMGIVAALRIK
jgi:putative ABC transport system permease protein